MESISIGNITTGTATTDDYFVFVDNSDNTTKKTPASSIPGSFSGPASSADNAIMRFDGTTGKIAQNSGATIDDSGNITATNLSGTNTGNETTSSINTLYGTTNAFTAGSIELGHASDSTLSRVSAGVVAVEGKTLANLTDSQTFGGVQTFAQVICTNNAITATGNAATVPVGFRTNTVTNNSAATLTITLTTSGAVNRQIVEVCILDATAVAQTITWVNTENSTVTAPTTSNGSTTLPLSVLFQYNSATSKWRTLAVA